MTTLSDRNLSYVEAVAAGLVPKDTSGGYVLTPPGASMTYPDTKFAQDLRATRDAEMLMTPDLRAQLIKMDTEAVKADAGKPDWSLVPFEALEGMVNVLEFGAKKYSRNNWQTGGGFRWTRVLASCLRHIFAFMRGEDVDPESGLSHISHAQCNLLFLAYYIRNKSTAKDDRH